VFDSSGVASPLVSGVPGMGSGVKGSPAAGDAQAGPSPNTGGTCQ